MNSKDPFSILGLPADTSPALVEDRYRELVRRHPPDQDPDTFQLIRDAYRAIQDPERRAEDRLFGPPPLADLEELIDLLSFRRRPLGAEVWRRQLLALRKHWRPGDR